MYVCMYASVTEKFWTRPMASLSRIIQHKPDMT
jgi:hypothetical protein